MDLDQLIAQEFQAVSDWVQGGAPPPESGELEGWEHALALSALCAAKQAGVQPAPAPTPSPAPSPEPAPTGARSAGMAHGPRGAARPTQPRR